MPDLGGKLCVKCLEDCLARNKLRLSVSSYCHHHHCHCQHELQLEGMGGKPEVGDRE